MTTINGSGTLVSRRHQVWGTGFTIITSRGVARSDVYTQPLDESLTGQLSIGKPGMGFNNAKLPTAGSFVVEDGITLPQVILPVVPSGPLLTATASTPPAIGPLSVNFTVTPTGVGPYTYLWDFGDGQTSTQQNPTHVYTQPGEKSVTVTVIADDGGRTTQQLYVHAGIAFSVEAQFAPINTGSSPLAINFYCFPADGVAPLTYLWDFGDGSTSTQQNPSHTYTSPGDFQASVVITDSVGHKTSALLAVPILAPLSADPIRFPDIGPVGLVTTFIARIAGGRAPYTVQWDFADGFGSVELNPVHQYKREGFYNVLLRVTDADGRIFATYRSVDVGPAALFPPLDIRVLPLEQKDLKPIYGWTTVPLI